MAEIALSNKANITLATIPTGLTEPSINSIALFTIETPTQTGTYSTHVGSGTVAELYGTNSLTYKMAQAIFSQTPNIITGNGCLYVIPYVATSATSTTNTTPNIIANIDNFKEVTNGSLTIVIDGKSNTVTGLNFSNITSVADIVEVLKGANLDVFIDYTQTASTSASITFASKMVGTDSTISFGTSSSGTDITGTNYLKTATSTVVEGANSTNQETLSEAFARVKDVISFGGVLTTQVLENDKVIEFATTVQEENVLYLEATASLENITDLGNSIKSGAFTHSHIVAYSNGLEDMKLCISGALSKALSVNWYGSNTANTLDLKQLATIQPDLNLNQTYYNNAKENGVDLYGAIQGYSCYFSFENGAYIDERVMDMFLKSKLEIADFNVLAKTNTKIAQTEIGMNMIKSAQEQVLIQGVRNGYIASGKWNNPSSRFGNPEDFDANILQHGYYQYSQPISQQAQTEREQRKAPTVQVAVKRSGAIHSINGEVIIER